MIKNKPIGVLTVDQQLSMTNLLCSLPIAQSSLRLQGKYIYYFSKHRKIDYYTLVLRKIIGRTITNIFFYSDRDNEIKTIIIRDGTINQDQIEIRRVFKHPNFKFPSLYDDIAVAELGSLIFML